MNFELSLWTNQLVIENHERIMIGATAKIIKII
jgi:hypothetical protein